MARTTVPTEVAGPTVLAVTAEYLSAIGAAPAGGLRDSSGPIETLVPLQRGVYARYMARGETAFRRGDYAGAFDEFRIAHDASEGGVESLLGLAHSRIAAAEKSYAVASLYLQRALRAMPELALAPLRPAKLFGDFDKYRRCVDRLEGHLRRRGDDVDAQLAAAYLAWFDGRLDAAQDALRRARRARTREVSASAATASTSTDPVLEAIDTFQRGMAVVLAERLDTVPLPDLPAPAPNP